MPSSHRGGVNLHHSRRRNDMRCIQRIITPAAGKRLIAKATAARSDVRAALQSGTVVIIAGSTNGYVAEEILTSIGQADGFVRKRFFRGVTLPPSRPTTESGRLSDQSAFPGDVVIVNGEWQRGETVFDAVSNLEKGDVIIKGANAFHLSSKRAAVTIGHPEAGTIGAAIQVVIGRRVKLLIPLGLEKRVDDDLDLLAAIVNAPDAEGPRLFPVPGETLCELDAIHQLTGATARLIAGGGIAGAEGSVWLAVSGEDGELEQAELLISSIAKEPMFAFE
jgi:hypothetical protein